MNREIALEEAGRAGHGAKGRRPAARKEGTGHLFVPWRWHRPAVLKWLRRTHAWLGVWGAVLGLLFGFTGLLLNHRATMKIPGASYTNTQWQLQLPQPLPADIGALGAYLQRELHIDRAPHQKKVEAAGPTPWPGATQPERWTIAFATPRETVNAEYWVGNASVSVRRMDPNLLARLSRLHMATGASAAWILLTDTLAGGLIALSLTGILLWTRLHGSRLRAAGLVGTCLTLALVLAATGW
ncbi:MAG: PepSY-associated TM helix domain-containing protein [Comamonas sp.]